MGNLLKVGCNFTYDLIDGIKHLNQLYEDNRVNELYGSRAESAYLSARPKFRLPRISEDEFVKYISEVHNAGLSFNYTLNSSCIGSKGEIISLEDDIKKYISFLIYAGVDTITVTLPYMAGIVRTVSPDVGIEVSTIAHIDSVTQVKIWKEKYNITKICCSLNKNRDIEFLESCSEYCRHNDITLTLMVNEFCGNGIERNNTASATGCIFRDHCYQLHSIGYEKDEHLCNDYPMGECIGSRNKSIVWLKSNFIRPEDQCLYNKIGINHFKVTGRTGSTSYLLKVIKAYLSESYNGNLLDLWKHLETIENSRDTDYVYRSQYYLDNKKLEGFLQFWFENRHHVCANEVCGETCIYCDDFLKRMVSTQ